MNQQAGIIWSSSDPLFSAVEETKVLLEQIHLSFELTNGNVEKELKLLVAGALRGASHPYRESYLSVRDKAVNGKAIDLLALTSLRDGRKAAPAFWAEFKCSFREAGTDAVFAVATEALAQVWRYSLAIRDNDWVEFRKFPGLVAEIMEFREQLLLRPVYIVHFLNSTPSVDCKLPEVIMRKFPRTAPPVTACQLEAYYRSEVPSKEPHDSGSDAECRPKSTVTRAELRQRAHEFQRLRSSSLTEKLKCTPEDEGKKIKEIERNMADLSYAIKLKGKLDDSRIIHLLSDPPLEAVVSRYRPPAGLSV